MTKTLTKPQIARRARRSMSTVYKLSSIDPLFPRVHHKEGNRDHHTVRDSDRWIKVRFAK